MIAILGQSPCGSPEQLKSLKLGLDGIDIGDDSSDERPPPAPDDDRIHVRRPLKDILSDIPHHSLRRAGCRSKLAQVTDSWAAGPRVATEHSAKLLLKSLQMKSLQSGCGCKVVKAEARSLVGTTRDLVVKPSRDHL